MTNTNFRKTADILRDAVGAKKELAGANEELLNAALISMADSLCRNAESILKANKRTRKER